MFVTHEHRYRLVAADAHRNRLGHSSADHVADCCLTEVMKDSPRHVGGLELFVPGLPEINYRHAGAIEDKLGKLGCSVFLVNRPFDPAALHQIPQSW